MDDSVNLGGGVSTEYTLLIYLTGTGSIAVSKTKGRSSVQGKDSSALVGGETNFYGMLQEQLSANILLLQSLLKML